MRGLLSEERLIQIGEQTPNTQLLEIITGLSPDAAAIAYGPDSDIPIAIVCLQDAGDYTQAARYALQQCIANMIWYREECDPPNEVLAVSFGQFYADDVALRLYSAAEHLASFIQIYLGIPEDDLKPHKRARVSKQSIIGHFLRKKKPHHEITRFVQRLAEDGDWCFTKCYRDKWVHHQRPRLHSTGVVYDRRKRWIKTEAKTWMPLGVGDQPSLTIDELTLRIKGGLAVFITALEGIAQYYISQSEFIQVDSDGTVTYNTGFFHWRSIVAR